MPCAKIIFLFQNEKQQRPDRLFCFVLMNDAIQLLSPGCNITPLQVNLPWFKQEDESAEDGQSTGPKQKTLGVHEADSN